MVVYGIPHSQSKLEIGDNFTYIRTRVVVDPLPCSGKMKLLGSSCNSIDLEKTVTFTDHYVDVNKPKDIHRK